MEQEKKDKWRKIIEDMEDQWISFLGDITKNHLAQLKRLLSKDSFKDEELQYILNLFMESLVKETVTLSDIRAVISMIGKDTRIAPKHSQSIEDIKERNLKSTMVKKALENYVSREEDELILVHIQEEDAS